MLVGRAKENSIEKVSPEKYFDAVIRQVYIPKDGEACMQTMSLIDEMAEKVAFYRLGCNMDDSAAKCSFDMLKGN